MLAAFFLIRELKLAIKIRHRIVASEYVLYFPLMYVINLFCSFYSIFMVLFENNAIEFPTL